MRGRSQACGGSERIRIAYLVRQLGVGGLENVVVELANALEPSRFACSIVSFAAPGPLQNKVHTAQVQVVALNQSGGNNPVLVYRLYRFLRQQRPHIVQTHNWATLLEGFLGAKLAGVPLIVHAEHGTIESRARNLFLQRHLWKKVHRVLCVSQAHRRRLADTVRFPYQRLQPILNGVDTSLFAPRPGDRKSLRTQLGLKPECLYIGTVGNLRPVKNHALLLRVSQQVCRRYQNVRFVLIGHGPLREQLAAYAQELGIQHQVQFLGTRADIPELLNALDIFVLPSLSEGLPMSVLEAMACGLPVVATQVGGLPEVIEDGKTGLLVPSQDEQQLTLALEVLIQHEKQRKVLGEQGRKRVVEHFSVQKMTNEYQELYESLVSGSGL